jgi:hypothetical protein
VSTSKCRHATASLFCGWGGSHDEIRAIGFEDFAKNFTLRVSLSSVLPVRRHSVDLSDISTGDFKMIRRYYTRRDP